MRWIRVSVMLSVLVLAVWAKPAEAQFILCNKTASAKIFSSVGYKEGERWISRGWFPIDKDQCATILTQALTGRYYYIFAESEGRKQTWGSSTNEFRFCVVRPEPFTIYTRDCTARNYQSESFVQVDTGNSTKWTQNFVSDTPAAPSSGEKWRLQVEKAVTEAARSMSKQGYELSDQVYTGSLAKSGHYDMRVTLEGGRRYRVIGRCDDDCSDLDLRLYNSAGTEVNADVEADRVPMVGATPVSSATYTVRVIMSECSTTTCYYSVGVFASPR